MGAVALLGVLAACAWATTARAESTKTTPSAGVSHIHRWNVTVRGALQDYHVLLVELANPALKFRVSDQADRNHPVSWYGPRYGAQLAVNASFFNFTERAPCGPTQSAGAFWTNAWSGCSASVVLGAGQMAIVANGAKLTGPWPATASFATDGVSGHPWLIRDGKQTGPWTEPGSINTRNARTALGVTATGKTMILVVVEAGRAGASGMTGADLVLVFNEFGARQALNLDGTGSTGLWIASEGGLVTTPSEMGTERAVANALMILPSVTPTDAGVDAADAPATDSAAAETSTEDASDSATVGPEDPTGDAGEVIDGAIYQSEEPPTGLPQSPAGDNTGCACTTTGARATWPSLGVALALLFGLARRARRG